MTFASHLAPAPLERIEVDWLLAQPATLPAQHGACITINREEGRIAQLGASAPTGNGLIVLPGLANAHDHARAICTSALGAFDRPLESWLFYLGVVPGVDPYLAAASAFGRSVLHGVGRLMVHYTRLQGTVDPLSEARAVAAAARDIGVHTGFAVALRDRHPVSYADTAYTLRHLPDELRRAVSTRLDSPPMPPSAQLALADEIARHCHAKDFNVQYGPAGVQWCTRELLELIAERSAQTGRQVHMHLLETLYQREWADREFPQGIVRFLHDIGLLSERLTLAHCTYCRPDELALIAQSGAIIAVNTSSNLSLRSGIAPVAQMVAHGCKVAMGLDGMALDDDDDALRELRLLYHLHKGRGYERTLSRAHAWEMASRHGRYVVSGLAESAKLHSGEVADLLVLNGRALMQDRLFDDDDVFDFVLARATAQHIDRVIVDGQTIVSGGRVLGIDLETISAEMLAQLRAKIDASDRWRADVKLLDHALESFYSQGLHLGCC
ncbi:amidohydrolase family protein [Paraburkholderia fungorum]|jgi:5-methylthioadenosine/S-adenosylhomocysteine deaminase|uniref:amidohydrolase family protein n=1 Tax=Paraburkholderia fungorum TaxID=134537 RepID=UPI0038B9F119